MSEHDHQAALFQWAQVNRAQYPELDSLFAIPNGGKREKATAARMKDEGVKPGVPDVCLPVARGLYHGLFVEMKDRGGRISPEQRDWMERLAAQGYYVTVAWDWLEASRIIERYLQGDC